MNLCEQLKEEYLKEISALISSHKEESKKLSEEGSSDEAILETIKVNICEIFYTVFNVSYKKSCRNGEDSGLKKLGDAYFDFFDKIPVPWKEKMVKDKEHNMMEEYYKEEIKLEMADEIKELFIKHYNRLGKEV